MADFLRPGILGTIGGDAPMHSRGDDMVIDGHNHLGGPDKGDGKTQSPDDILRRMDAAGVDMAVVFPFNEAEPGVSFSRTNTYIAQEAGRHPDRLIGFCRLDPNFGKDAVSELVRSVRGLGLRGIKLHPSSQKFSLDDPALIDILAAAQDMRIPVLFDTGKKDSPPSGIAKLAARFPELTFIMAHMNLLEETIEAARSARNIVVGTAGYFNVKGLGRAIAALGAERFASGSDSPYIKMDSELGKFMKIQELTEHERRCVTGNNIADVFGVKP